MKKISETVIFFGSGPVAAESLALLAEDFEVEAVVTKSRPAHHTGDVPVIELAAKLGLKTLTVSNQSELGSLFSDKAFKSRLGIVIDFGIIIPKTIIDCFSLGIVNSHFSLLPRWRGADPISFAILKGDEETGVSLMLIVEALDEGPLLAQRSLKLTDKINTPALTKELISLSHEMIVDILPRYINGAVTPKSQEPKPSYSRKLEKSDSPLDWKKPGFELEREVRAYYDWPRSRTKLGDINVVITEAHVVPGEGSPGEIWHDAKQLGVYTSKGIFVIDRLIPAGKKEMPIEAFLAGYKIS